MHVHLEGTASPRFTFETAQKNGVALDRTSLADWERDYAFADLPGFIELYIRAAGALTRPEDYGRLTVELLHEQARQNVLYSEVFLSASLLVGKLPPDEVLGAIAAAVAEHGPRLGTDLRLIPDIARHWPETADFVVDMVLAGHAMGLVVGMGLGGPEAGFPPDPFRDHFRHVRERGVHAVAHAGEAAGPESIAGAIEHLGAERIGHGCSVVRSPELMAHMATARIPIECCPISNYKLGSWPTGEPHPTRRMVAAGIVCSVNSDDPGFFGTTLADEYVLLHEQGFSPAELERMAMDTVDSLFLADVEKAGLRARMRGC